MNSPSNSHKSFLLGIATDNEDGHKRVTRSDQFSVIGGSQETHEKMAETVIKTFADIEKSGRHLVDVEPEELVDLLNKHNPDNC